MPLANPPKNIEPAIQVRTGKPLTKKELEKLKKAKEKKVTDNELIKK